MVGVAIIFRNCFAADINAKHMESCQLSHKPNKAMDEIPNPLFAQPLNFLNFLSGFGEKMSSEISCNSKDRSTLQAI